MSAAKTQRCGNCDQIPRSGWHRFAAFGPPEAKFGPQRGLKAPFVAKFGMHFGSIGGVFGSSALPRAPTGIGVTQNGLKRAQRESKWLKMAQNRPKIGQNGVKMAQSRVKMVQRPKVRSKWVKISQH